MRTLPVRVSSINSGHKVQNWPHSLKNKYGFYSGDLNYGSEIFHFHGLPLTRWPKRSCYSYTSACSIWISWCPQQGPQSSKPCQNNFQTIEQNINIGHDISSVSIQKRKRSQEKNRPQKCSAFSYLPICTTLNIHLISKQNAMNFLKRL